MTTVPVAPTTMPVTWPTGVDGPPIGDTTPPIIEPLADGVYWAWNGTVDGSVMSFTLVQLFVGDACIERFSLDECPSDNNSLDDPSVVVTATAEGLASVLVQDATTGVHYAVSGADLAALMAGQIPAGAPAGFQFSPGPFLVTITAGQVTAVSVVLAS
ncbi:MAG: hypothetical protein ACK5OX_14680 [Desertimonas sp.]